MGCEGHLTFTLLRLQIPGRCDSGETQPEPRTIRRPELGAVVEIPEVGVASAREGSAVTFAGGVYTVFCVCARQKGGLNCARVPHRPIGLPVAPR